jgi:mannose-6-phosphate isomerase-like protein (cupin superfamily)
MKKRRVVRAMDVMPYAPEGMGGAYQSRLLIESEGVGSERLQVVHASLKPGCTPGEGGAHPVPYDEAYYILRGQGLMEFDEGAEAYEVGPDTAIYIPGGTWHRITNTGTEDLEFLTLWPLAPQGEGINGVYDGRLRAWGTSFRLVNE